MLKPKIQSLKIEESLLVNLLVNIGYSDGILIILNDRNFSHF